MSLNISEEDITSKFSQISTPHHSRFPSQSLLQTLEQEEVKLVSTKSMQTMPQLAFSPITKMPYHSSFVFPIDERSEELMYT
jgi:hypothetical protein